MGAAHILPAARFPGPLIIAAALPFPQLGSPICGGMASRASTT